MTVEPPKDAEGREIPLDTEVLYDNEGKRREVDWYTFYPDKDIWDVVLADSSAHFSPRNLSLTQPDSWEKLLDDLDRATDKGYSIYCTYFGKKGAGCDSCRAQAYKEQVNRCSTAALCDISSRIRKLRGED